MVGRRYTEGLLLSLMLALGACAGLPRGSVGGAPSANLTGVWEGQFRSTVGDGAAAGDTRIERQAWRLSQVDDAIVGFYVVELTMISGDGRPYVCSGAPRFSTLVRLEVRGRMRDGQIDLEETGAPRAKGTCQPTFQRLGRYRAAVRGDVLVLTDGERRYPLHRRATPATADRLLDFEGDQATPASAISFSPEESAAAPVDVQGVWIWERRGTVPTGDEKIEREEWHLVQDGAKVTGWYDRAVRQISTDGHAYRCNRALDFSIVTRYQVTGEVRGNAIVIHERAFEILQESPCDDGQRRLDAYKGQAAGGEIRLLWGPGAQVLRRARPNVPSQRF